MAQTVIVTGASSGIGRATTLKFAAAGAAVLAVGRNELALAEVVKEARGAGGRADRCVADITAPDVPDRIVAACLEPFGTLTTLVNAAGIIATGTIETTTDEQWAKVMDINLHAPFRLMRAATAPLDRVRRLDRQRVERERAALVSRACSRTASASRRSIT